MELTLIGVIVKPLVGLFFVFFMALGIWAVQKCASPRVRSFLLRKLW